MIHETYNDGVLVESWDDETRTYTDHRTDPPTTRPYNADENAAADARAEAETRLDDLEARVTALEAVVMGGAVPDDPAGPDVPEWADLSPAGWWYAGTLLRDVDGTIYRNTSGTVLTEPPSGFPGAGVAWLGQLFVKVTTGSDPDPDPDPTHPEGYVGPWSAQATYEVGDVCDRDGRYYRCKVAHGPEYEGTWGPGPSTSTIWDDIGPA